MMAAMHKLGELFCGAGGLAFGAVTAKIKDPGFRIEHQWATDIDRDMCETYSINICNGDHGTVHCEDIRKLDMSKLPAVDALAFGFPCNDFSAMGKRKGLAGSYGSLCAYGIKALRHFRPKWFIAENVKGLLSVGKGGAFRAILDEMRGCGYNVVPHLYKFERYGVPQTRHRIVFVGTRDDLGMAFKVPSPAPCARSDNTCYSALMNPPIPENAFNHEFTVHCGKVVARLECIKPGESVFTADVPDRLKLAATEAFKGRYKRLDPSKPAFTLLAQGIGGNQELYHWSEPRTLTNRERARLQTFPDDFRFFGSRRSVRMQIGMAVPCDGARAIFEAVLKSFAGIAYDHVNPNIGWASRARGGEPMEGQLELYDFI